MTFPDPSGMGGGQITVADFNGDGRPDVAVSDGANSDSVGIFLNTGNGTFSGPLSFPSNLTTISSLAVVDFNGDGKPDFGVLDATIRSVSVLLGNGDGTLGPPVVSALPFGGYAIAPFYFKGSSYASLAVVVPDTSYPTYGALAAEVLTGHGNGSFVAVGLYPSVGFTYYAEIAAGDVNRDGLPDLVIGARCDDPTTDASCTRGQISVLIGLQDGTFAPPRTTVVQDGNLSAVTLADLNGDGNLDIVAQTETGVLVSFGNGDGTFQAPTIYAGLQNPLNQPVVADLNADGLPDILQPEEFNQIAILYNQGITNSRSVVALQSSLEPSTYGQTTTLTSSVTSKAGLATGSVTFKDGAASFGTESLAGGSASLSTAVLGAAVHSFSAAYSGNGVVPAGNSAGFYQLVKQATSSVTLRSNVNHLT